MIIFYFFKVNCQFFVLRKSVFICDVRSTPKFRRRTSEGPTELVTARMLNVKYIGLTCRRYSDEPTDLCDIDTDRVRGGPGFQAGPGLGGGHGQCMAGGDKLQGNDRRGSGVSL